MFCLLTLSRGSVIYNSYLKVVSESYFVVNRSCLEAVE